MTDRQEKLVPPNASFGFIFQMVANGGGGGTNPKSYQVTAIGNDFLRGFTSDNAAAVTQVWPSDPGDSLDPVNRTPPGARVYVASLSPNNIRLSQVSLQSIRASHGISRENNRVYLPTSSNYNRTLAGAAVSAVVGDFAGCRRITVQLIEDAAAPTVPIAMMVNGLCFGFGIAASRGPLANIHTFHLTNLGAVQVVNLSTGVITVGVHVETEL